MIKLLYICIGVYLSITFIIFGVDYYHYLLERYGRFHIGRFRDEEDWEKRVIKKYVKWLKKEPTVKLTDNNRYIILDMMTKKYRNSTVQSWQKGALLLGLQKYGSKYKKEIQKCINMLIDENGEFINTPTNIDCGFLAYAILKNSESLDVEPAMTFASNLIINNMGTDGMIHYTNDKESTECYVDTIGLAIPFLVAYAETYHAPEIKKIALKQLKLFTQYGLDKGSLLPNHAFDSRSKLPLGVFGWGRGCAWYVIGLMDSYLELKEDNECEWIRKQIQIIAEEYRKYQREDGGFGYIFQMRYGYDSSATAVMAYFYKKCYDIFEKEIYYDIYIKCLKKLMEVTKINGALDWCQGDTKAIGTFSQTFGIMPFAQGMMIRSFEEK